MNTMDLIAAIEREGPLSPALRAAFASVDRATFVQQHYTHQGKRWVLAETGDTAYQDQALVTQLDRRGMPSSSSSKPSVMAAMLDALTLQPGQRMLEIGTGTGYNAALVASLVGVSGCVFSIDIDPLLLPTAQKNLLALPTSEQVLIAVGDGFNGYPPGAPYDRIMVTAGFRRVPHAWVEQLVPGGVLVGNMLGSLISILIRLVKEENETDVCMTGNIVSHGAFFMEMRQPQVQPVPPPDWPLYDAFPAEPVQADLDLAHVLDHQAFLCFLQGRHPGLQLHLRYLGGDIHDKASFARVLIDPATTASLMVPASGETILSRGGLWPSIKESYTRWWALGCPALSEHSLEWSADGSLRVGVGSEYWVL